MNLEIYTPNELKSLEEKIFSESFGVKQILDVANFVRRKYVKEVQPKDNFFQDVPLELYGQEINDYFQRRILLTNIIPYSKYVIGKSEASQSQQAVGH
ncbi:MAG: hypothetical protein KKF52_01055, partial [Nanoarchaeota archaeon]|nr:hypothetical protein [Nanoarchaeota archaeon]